MIKDKEIKLKFIYSSIFVVACVFVLGVVNDKFYETIKWLVPCWLGGYTIYEYFFMDSMFIGGYLSRKNDGYNKKLRFIFMVAGVMLVVYSLAEVIRVTL